MSYDNEIMYIKQDICNICHRIQCTDSYNWSDQEKVPSLRRGLANICVYISIDSHLRVGTFVKLRLDPKAQKGWTKMRGWG